MKGKKDEDPELNELIKASFENELKYAKQEFNTDSKDYLKKCLIEYINRYKINSNEYYAPYSAICQSSGFGKTRACFSLRDDFYVVYCCLRPEESNSGYPPRSCIADYFTKIYTNETILENFLIDYFNLFIENLNKDESFYSQFKNGFSNELKALIDEISPKNGTKNNNNSKTIEKKSIYIYKQTKPLVFIFDEASSLLGKESRSSNYFLLRKILTESPENVFTLFLDTFSVLSRFMPVSYQDPSLRRSYKNRKVFDPIYLLPTWDAYADYDSITNIKESIKIENVCKFGRVLWASLYQSYLKDKDKLENKIKKRFLVELACDKIIGGKAFAERKYDELDYLAILSTRIGAINTKLVSINQKLVAEKMAVCTYVDIDENRFEIDYPSEPILADAGANHLSFDAFASCIKHLQNCVSTSIVSQGEVGEAIAKLILIRAMDKACYKSNTSICDSLFILKYIQVGEFLTSLYGKCKENKNCGKNNKNEWFCDQDKCIINMIIRQYGNDSNYAQKLLNAYMNFNHFSRANCYLDKIDFKKVIKRCAAIHCKHGETAIDLVIPISLNLENFDEISAILIQVKLNSHPGVVSYLDAFDNIEFDKIINRTLNPYLLIYMQLGCPIKSSSFIVKPLDKTISNSKQDKYRSIIFSRGISEKIFPILTSIEVSYLINLANPNPKLLFNAKFPDLNQINEKNYLGIRYFVK